MTRTKKYLYTLKIDAEPKLKDYLKDLPEPCDMTKRCRRAA